MSGLVKVAIGWMLFDTMFAHTAQAKPRHAREHIDQLVTAESQILPDCRPPVAIPDVLACRNTAVIQSVPAANRISAVIAALVPSAAIACTTSQSSAQPAAPELGDLRCFLVFDSGLIVSFNLVAGLNGDRLEVSQPVRHGERDVVILANIRTATKTNQNVRRCHVNSEEVCRESSDILTLGEVLADAFRPIDSNTRLNCAFCHRPVDHPEVEIDGQTTYALAGIRLNETVRRTVPKNGQVSPESLMGRISELKKFHQCNAHNPDATETCRRISALLRAPRLFKLDNPPAF